MNPRALSALVAVLLVVVVLAFAAGPLGLVGSTVSPTTTPSGTSAAARSSESVESATPGVSALPRRPSPSGPVAQASPSTNPPTKRPAKPPASTAPVPPREGDLSDVPIVPVTNFRSTATSTTLKEVQATLAGTSTRYQAVELVSDEAPAILTALHLDRPADASRLVLAQDEAALAADLTKSGKRLAFLPADEVRPEVRALAWGNAAPFRRRPCPRPEGLAVDCSARDVGGRGLRPRRRRGRCSQAATSCSIAACTRRLRSRARAPTSRSMAVRPTSPRGSAVRGSAGTCRRRNEPATREPSES